VLALQALAVHWGPAQAIFRTVDLTTPQWLIAITVGASVLVLEEARKAVRWRPKTCRA
jgi:Ca2+-transporting ATPase